MQSMQLITLINHCSLITRYENCLWKKSRQSCLSRCKYLERTSTFYKIVKHIWHCVQSFLGKSVSITSSFTLTLTHSHTLKLALRPERFTTWLGCTDDLRGIRALCTVNMYRARVHLCSVHNNHIQEQPSLHHSGCLQQIEEPLYWFRGTRQPACTQVVVVRGCIASRIVCSQSRRERRRVGGLGGGIWKNKQRALPAGPRRDDVQPTGSAAAHRLERGMDWRTTGSAGEMARFMLHDSWKYNEQEPTNQAQTDTHTHIRAQSMCNWWL